MIKHAGKSSRGSQNKSGLSIDEIKRLAAGREVEILERVAGIPPAILDGKHHPCPKCGGKDRCRLIDDNAGAMHCNQCFNKGNGDFLAAIQWMLGVSLPEAIELVADYIGNGNRSYPSTKKHQGLTGKAPDNAGEDPINESEQDDGGVCYPTAEAAIEAIERSKGKSVGRWSYHNAQGEIVCWVVRWDMPNGDKVYFPFSRFAKGWRFKGLSGARPLYRMAEIEGASRVFVCEGEKAADALRGLGLVAVTSIGGANVAKKSDWAPVANSGAEVVIWPDNDEKGDKYLSDVVDCIAAINPSKSALVVRPDGMKPKADAFDWVELQGNAKPEAIIEGIERLVANAKLAAKKESEQTGLIITRLDTVQPVDVTWLWPSRIAIGKLTLISGDPGVGKSFLTMDLAARVTRGAPWPDGSGLCPEGSVVLIGCEDGLDDTIVPRLNAAGADLSKIVAIEGAKDEGKERSFSLSRDLPRLEMAVSQLSDCRLVIIDPITAFVGDGTDDNSNTEIRSVLAPLSALAASKNMAVVAVSHLRKGAAAAIYRTMGSLGYVAAARAVFAVTKDRDSDSRRIMVPVKNNIGNDTTGLAYELTTRYSGGEIPSVVWCDGVVDISADDALAPADGNGADENSLAEAKQWLKDALHAGPKAAAELFDEAKNGEGISSRTLERAKKQIGVKSYRPSVPGPWFWRLQPLAGGVEWQP